MARPGLGLSTLGLSAFGLLALAVAVSAGPRRMFSTPPLPPRRPPDLTGSSPVPKPTPKPEPVPAAVADLSCPHVLADKRLVVVAAPPVTGPHGCGIAAPVTLKAVILEDGTKIPFTPPSLIRCDLAAALGDWFRTDVAAAVKKAGGLAEILGSVGYECRLRDHLAHAKLSEHAKGNAFDLRGLVLRNGVKVLIADQDPQNRGIFAQMKASACARFTTVLGPGADSFHKLHLHVDLEQRHHGFRICEWDVN